MMQQILTLTHFCNVRILPVVPPFHLPLQIYLHGKVTLRPTPPPFAFCKQSAVLSNTGFSFSIYNTASTSAKAEVKRDISAAHFTASYNKGKLHVVTDLHRHKVMFPFNGVNTIAIEN